MVLGGCFWSGLVSETFIGCWLNVGMLCFNLLTRFQLKNYCLLFNKKIEYWIRIQDRKSPLVGLTLKMCTGRRQDFSVDWQRWNRKSYRFQGPQERLTKPNEASQRKMSEGKKEKKTARKKTGDKQDLHLYRCGLRSVEKHMELWGGGSGVLTAKTDRKSDRTTILKERFQHL